MVNLAKIKTIIFFTQVENYEVRLEYFMQTFKKKRPGENCGNVQNMIIKRGL